MPTNTTPLLVLHCHPNDPVANTVLLPTDNNRADMHVIHQLTNYAYTPAIYRLTNRRALYLTTIATRRLYRTTT